MGACRGCIFSSSSVCRQAHRLQIPIANLECGKQDNWERVCCGESEGFKAGKEEIIGTFATYKTWWDTVRWGHLVSVCGTRAWWKTLVESICRRDFYLVLAWSCECLCVHSGEAASGYLQMGMSVPTEILSGRRKWASRRWQNRSAKKVERRVISECRSRSLNMNEVWALCSLKMSIMSSSALGLCTGKSIGRRLLWEGVVAILCWWPFRAEPGVQCRKESWPGQRRRCLVTIWNGCGFYPPPVVFHTLKFGCHALQLWVLKWVS